MEKAQNHPAVEVTEFARKHNLNRAGKCLALGWTAQWQPTDLNVKVAVLSPTTATAAELMAARAALEASGVIVRKIVTSKSPSYGFEIHFGLDKPKPKVPRASALEIRADALEAFFAQGARSVSLVEGTVAA